jgi:hypothetical protein
LGNITHSDIKSCASYGIVTEVDGKYRVTGSDCDGEILRIVCVNENGVIVITVF